MWPLNLKSITHVGEMNSLEVLRISDEGFILDGGNKGEILLPASRAPDNCAPGRKIEVFVYPENDDTLLATCNTPKAQVGECALLKVVSVTRAGAFLDWGIQKDLLVPVSQQLTPMAGRQILRGLHCDGSATAHHWQQQVAPVSRRARKKYAPGPAGGNPDRG